MFLSRHICPENILPAVALFHTQDMHKQYFYFGDYVFLLDVLPCTSFLFRMLAHSVFNSHASFYYTEPSRLWDQWVFNLQIIYYYHDKTPNIIPLNLEEDISLVSEMNYCNKLSNQRHSSPATWCTNYHNHSPKHTAWNDNNKPCGHG